jgi:DNA-binding response OmpR family regulator
MANILLIGVKKAIAAQIRRTLAAERHRIEQRPWDFPVTDLTRADMIFAGGEPSQYLALLRLLRDEKSAVPFVVLTRVPETTEWLNALEAGATDYCSAPFKTHRIRWLMESALPGYRTVTA